MKNNLEVNCFLSWGMILFCLFFPDSCFSQTLDLARIEYTFVPQVNSKNTVNRFRGFVNYPIRVGTKGCYIISGIEYRNIDLDIKDPVPFETKDLGKFQVFRFSLACIFKLGKDWRFAVKTGAEAASNFELRTLGLRDISYSGSAFLIRNRKGDEVKTPSRFIIGLNYSTNAGRPFPIPIVNYYRKFHPEWSYSLGSPKTNLKYFWNKKNAIQAFITLDGFFSNIQKGRNVLHKDGSSTLAENISMTLVLGGLGYERGFTKHLFFYAYGGYTLYNEIRLRDQYDNNLYRLNNKNTFYLRTGVKFKI